MRIEAKIILDDKQQEKLKRYKLMFLSIYCLDLDFVEETTTNALYYEGFYELIEMIFENGMEKEHIDGIIHKDLKELNKHIAFAKGY